MTDRLRMFIENMVDDGFSRDDVLAALSDGELLSRYFPAEDDEALQREVDDAYDEVGRWPERFVFRYRIGYLDGEYEGEEDIVASSQDEAEDLVLEKHPSARIVWHECLGLANGTLEEVLNL